MQMSEIRAAYPLTYRLLSRLLELPGIHQRAAEGLSEHALARIEAGSTDERDVRVLLVARSQQMAKQSGRRGAQ